MPSTRYALSGLLAFATLLFAATPALAATITVNTNADASSDATCSLRDAITAANTDAAVGGCVAGSGDDLIVFDDTVFKIATGFVLTGSAFEVTSTIDIDGADLVTIDANAMSRVFTVSDGTLRLLDIDLTNGQASIGGLVYVASGSNFEADGVTAMLGDATGDDADQGGGVLYIDGGSATVMNSTFASSSATGASGSGGAVLNKGGTLFVIDTTIEGNTANRAGGGIEDAGGTTTLTNVTLDSNDAGANPGNGGGLHTGGGTVIVEGGSVTNNTAVEGGGLWSSGSLMVRPDATDAPTVIDNNTAFGDADEQFEGGGGLFNKGGTMTVIGATISNNSATGPGGSGGGAFTDGGDGSSLSITASTFTGNGAVRAGGGIELNGGTLMLASVSFDANDAGDSPGNGGAIHVTTGTTNATGGTVSQNTATEGGGFWNNAGSTMTLTSVDFTGNMASGEAADNGGGALYNNGGTLGVEGGMLSGNTATSGSGSGGALLSTDGDVTIADATFSMNEASRAGGAIEVLGGALTITGTDFGQNTAGSSPGNGGAIHVTGTATTTVTGGEVTGNVAAREGGGFWNQTGAAMTVTGTSFSGNTAQGPAADDGGGALFNNGGTLEVNDASLDGNTATGASGSGGAVLNLGGVFVMTGGAVTGNTANRAGGGIEDAGGTVLLTGVTIAENSIDVAAPGNGGGLHSGGGTVTIQGGSFFDNTAVEGGGVWVAGDLSIQHALDETMAEITGNEATGDDATNGGGGVYTKAGTATITNTVIDGNRATGASGSGGGLFVADGVQATVTGGSISGNMANRAGGGIEVADDGETEATALLVLESVMVDDNSIADAAPGNGGGLHSGGGDVEVYGGSFSGNTATEGGGLWSNANLLIDTDDDDEATQITGNTGTGDDATNGGGGVYAESGAAVEIYDAIIDDNVASGTAGSGGGVFVADGAQVDVEGGSVSGNTANRAGGGIEVADDGETDEPALLILADVTVDGNSIGVAAPGNGGGLHVGGGGIALIEASTFSDNTAREGAGLWISGGGELDLLNSTVSGNISTEDGGGVYDQGDGGDINLANVTVAGNTAGTTGGGLLSASADGSTFTLANTLVGDNMAASGPDCSGMFASDGPNLVEDASDCTVAGMVIGGDALLEDLADNGGPTLTHALMEGSPAIDAGDSDFLEDQRGFPRSGATPDIGAFEFGAGTAPCTVTSMLGFSDLMAGGNERGEDESVVLTNMDEMNGVNLTGCTFAAYDARTQQITFAQELTSLIDMGGSLTFATGDGDLTLPPMSLPNEFGVILLVEGDANVGDALGEDLRANVIAAIVYTNEDSITDTFVGSEDNDDERANFSDAVDALIIATPVEGDEAREVDLSVFAAPNPVVGASVIRFGVEANAHVRVTLFDVLGREVGMLADAPFARGRHSAPLDAANLAAGMYLVRVQVGEEAPRTSRVTVVR